IWRIASERNGIRGEVCPSAMQWKANAIEQPNVRMSPILMDEKSGRNAAAVDVAAEAAGGAVMSTIPTKAKAAPRKAFQRGGRAPGGRSVGAMEKRGTSTTTRPVINADFEGVVRARPMV